MTHFLVSKADFEAFLDLVDAKWRHEPDYRSCVYRASFKLDNGVEVDFALTTLDVTPQGNFYGRYNAWTHVRFDTWIHSNVSLRGKGSRGEETAVKLWNTLAVLGEFDGMPNSLRLAEWYAEGCPE